MEFPLLLFFHFSTSWNTNKILYYHVLEDNFNASQMVTCRPLTAEQLMENTRIEAFMQLHCKLLKFGSALRKTQTGYLTNELINKVKKRGFSRNY
jgi:hypothetical protein